MSPTLDAVELPKNPSRANEWIRRKRVPNTNGRVVRRFGRRGERMGCINTKDVRGDYTAGPIDAYGQVSPQDVQLQASQNPTNKPNARKHSVTERRRVAVRGEADQGDIEQYVPKKHAKSEQDRVVIRQCINSLAVLQGLSTAQVETLVDAAFKEPVETGDVIINEGEVGDHFYMVNEGLYDLYIKSSGPQKLRTFKTGESFGELALLYNSPRSATIESSLGGSLWVLHRQDFRHVVVKGALQRTKMTDNFLKAVEVFTSLTDAQRRQLADCTEAQTFSDGEYVCQIGDKADSLYIVKSGQVVCTDDKKNELMRLSEGKVLGESCLERSADPVRKANVVAVGQTTLLRLTRDVVREQLGELADVVTANFKRKVMESIKINGLSIWAQLGLDGRETLIENLTEVTFPAGADIITQGQSNDTFYIIQIGEASVLLEQTGAMSGMAPKEIAKLYPMQYFGERALLTSEAAGATVRAKTKLVLFSCERKTFTEVFGPLQDLLDHEIQRRDALASKMQRPDWNDLEIRRILGVGTFGRVKLVVHKPTKATFALKCMRKAQVVETNQLQHVQHEKTILSQMDHPFILSLVGTYQDAGELYMLLEVALGGELFTYLSRAAPLKDSHSSFYTSQVVSIFSYMHSLQVVYRDLKPENLLLDKDGYIKMVDFGFAKKLNGGEKTWTLCGTPEYLAPEIILNKGHNFGADWWCVGILAYECLTSVTPFVADEPMDGYRKAIKGNITWTSSIGSVARDFVTRLLVQDPTKRLGCAGKGSLDVRNHPWFKNIDWKALLEKKIPAPFIPKIKSATDDSNFQEFDDEGIRDFPGDVHSRDMFKDFSDAWV